MRPSDPLEFGDVLEGWRPKRKVMVINPTADRKDNGGGWFLGMRLTDGRLYDGIGPRGGNIGLYQRQGGRKVDD